MGQQAIKDRDMGHDCARHARMFFNRPPLNLDAAVTGEFTPAPRAEMLDALERDYNNMSGMIFGQIPVFSDIIERIRLLEEELRA